MLLTMWLGCESMEPSGAVFAPVAEEVEAPPPPDVAEPTDGLAFPTAPPLTISSEQLAQGTVSAAAVVGVDISALPGGAQDPAPVEGLPAPGQFPVRVLSTLPNAQPPRAILGLPSGQEVVVSPGSILAEQGLVVMTVTGDRVQLARVEPAGDHATITSIELSAQYPARLP